MLMKLGRFEGNPGNRKINLAHLLPGIYVLIVKTIHDIFREMIVKS